MSCNNNNYTCLNSAYKNREGSYDRKYTCEDSPPRPHPMHSVSYECHKGIGCKLVHEAPNSRKGLYSSLPQCAAKCSSSGPPGPYSS